MAFERWNTHFDVVVEVEVFGVPFRLHQDPNSNNLGTTVWDASIVFAKFLQQNCRKGEFSRAKMRGKTALELGAGMGLAGMALALLGANVMLTDISSVLPLLERNAEQNVTKAALRLREDTGWAAGVVGDTSVAELDWADEACYARFEPPYDYIAAADCVYSEEAVPHLLRVVLAMTGPRSTVMITNEFRSQSVHDVFMDLFGRQFTIKKVLPSKMDPSYQHPLIHIYMLKRRKQPLPAAEAVGAAAMATGAAGEQDSGEEAGSEGAAGECSSSTAADAIDQHIGAEARHMDSGAQQASADQLGAALAKSLQQISLGTAASSSGQEEQRQPTQQQTLE